MRTLASDPTRVFTKDELLRTIWGFRTLGSTRTLDSHACRLRHKLGRGGDRFVVNVWGVGYRLVDGPPAELAAARAGARAGTGRRRGRAAADGGRPAAGRGAARAVAAGGRRPRRSVPSGACSCAAGASWSRAPATSCAAR